MKVREDCMCGFALWNPVGPIFDPWSPLTQLSFHYATKDPISRLKQIIIEFTRKIYDLKIIKI